MRCGARRAAAVLAALALAAAGCSDVVSSLTPFGLGTRGPDPAQVAYSGSWEGSTDSGGEVTFSVAGGKVVKLKLKHLTATCTQGQSFNFSETPLLIDGTAFGYDGPFDPQGRLVLTGTFTAADAAAGSFLFEGFATSAGCPTSGRGTFTAEKLPPANP